MAGVNLHEHIGRIIVAYIAERGVIRIVHEVTGQLINEYPTDPITLGQFKEITEKYRQMITP